MAVVIETIQAGNNQPGTLQFISTYNAAAQVSSRR
jgi:hypothetical protein